VGLVVVLVLMGIAEVPTLQLQSMVGSTLTIAISRYLRVCMLSSMYQQIGLIFSFGEVYRSFTSVERNGLFLDVLEPYVLNDRLKYEPQRSWRILSSTVMESMMFLL